MSQSSEQIEAKLCAYLEGELDEQGRAEIEKHLAGKPAHRKLLAEVARTRDLVRALPREAAPADLCEQFQGHLERAVLLDDAPDDAGTSSMRIGAWRPVLAMAALVVLAVGLGLVIYFGLPSAVPQRTVAVNNAAPPAATDSAGAVADERKLMSEAAATAPAGPAIATAGSGEADATSKDKTEVAKLDAVNAVTTPLLAPTASRQAGSQPEVPSLPALAQQVPKLWSPEQQRALFFARGGSGVAADPPANAPVYYVVSSPDPGAASQAIAEELSRLNVEWKSVGGPAAVATGVFGTGDEAARGGEREIALSKKSAGPTEPDAPADASAGSGSAGGGSAGGGSAGGLAGAAPGAAATTTGTPGQARDPAVAGTELAEASARPADQQTKEVEAPAKPAPSGGAEGLILVRNVTRQQAETVRVALAARQGPVQQVMVWGETTHSNLESASAGRKDLRNAGVLESRVAAPAPAPSADDTRRSETQALAQGEPAPPAGAGGVAGTGEPTTSPSGVLRRQGRSRNERSARGFGGFAEAPPAPGAGRGGAGGAAGAAADPSADAPAPDDEVIRRGDSLQLVLGDTAAPGSVHELNVRPDGTVTVPEIGDFSCAGLTVGQLRQRLDENYRAANPAFAEKVVVTKAGKPTAPVVGLEVAQTDAPARPDAGPGPGRGARRPADGAEVASRGGASAGRAVDADSFQQNAAPAPRPDGAEKTSRFARADSEVRQQQQEGASPPPPGQAPASTSPATSAAPTSADDERVDLVIVVRRPEADSGTAAAADGVGGQVPVPPAPPVLMPPLPTKPAPTCRTCASPRTGRSRCLPPAASTPPG